MIYGIDEELLNKIIKIFQGKTNIKKVILFGSRAKGNYKHGSDIDLALIGDLNIVELNNISIELDELDSPYLFDLCNYNKLNNKELKEHIDRVGKIIYERKN
jgi:predicted nucleotidyltransferase